MNKTLPVTPSQHYESEATFLLNELTRATDRAWSDGVLSLKTAADIQAHTADLRDAIREATK
jgi:hypothetical protein